MQSPPELHNSSVSFCPEPCAFPRLGSWSFRSSPGTPPLAPAPAEHRSVPLPFVARSPGLTWGRGPALPTAPSSRSARRSRLGVTAMAGRSGLGHSCHLRNRAARLIPAGLRGGGAGVGAAPPARGRDRAGSLASSAWVSGGRGPGGPPASRARRCSVLRSPRALLRFRSRRSGASSSERPWCVRLASSLRPLGPASHPRTPISSRLPLN